MFTCNELDSSFAASWAGGASYLARSARQFSLSHLEKKFLSSMIKVIDGGAILTSNSRDFNIFNLYRRRLTTFVSLFWLSGHALQNSLSLQPEITSSISWLEAPCLEAIKIIQIFLCDVCFWKEINY